MNLKVDERSSETTQRHKKLRINDFKFPLDCWISICSFLESSDDLFSLFLTIKGLHKYVQTSYSSWNRIRFLCSSSSLPSIPQRHVLHLSFDYLDSDSSNTITNLPRLFPKLKNLQLNVLYQQYSDDFEADLKISNFLTLETLRVHFFQHQSNQRVEIFNCPLLQSVSSYSPQKSTLKSHEPVFAIPQPSDRNSIVLKEPQNTLSNSSSFPKLDSVSVSNFQVMNLSSQVFNVTEASILKTLKTLCIHSYSKIPFLLNIIAKSSSPTKQNIVNKNKNNVIFFPSLEKIVMMNFSKLLSVNVRGKYMPRLHTLYFEQCWNLKLYNVHLAEHLQKFVICHSLMLFPDSKRETFYHNPTIQVEEEEEEELEFFEEEKVFEIIHLCEKIHMNKYFQNLEYLRLNIVRDKRNGNFVQCGEIGSLKNLKFLSMTLFNSLFRPRVTIPYLLTGLFETDEEEVNDIPPPQQQFQPQTGTSKPQKDTLFSLNSLFELREIELICFDSECISINPPYLPKLESFSLSTLNGVSLSNGYSLLSNFQEQLKKVKVQGDIDQSFYFHSVDDFSTINNSPLLPTTTTTNITPISSFFKNLEVLWFDNCFKNIFVSQLSVKGLENLKFLYISDTGRLRLENLPNLIKIRFFISSNSSSRCSKENHLWYGHPRRNTITQAKNQKIFFIRILQFFNCDKLEEIEVLNCCVELQDYQLLRRFLGNLKRITCLGDGRIKSRFRKIKEKHQHQQHQQQHSINSLKRIVPEMNNGRQPNMISFFELPNLEYLRINVRNPEDNEELINNNIIFTNLINTENILAEPPPTERAQAGIPKDIIFRHYSGSRLPCFEYYGRQKSSRAVVGSKTGRCNVHRDFSSECPNYNYYWIKEIHKCEKLKELYIFSHSIERLEKLESLHNLRKLEVFITEEFNRIRKLKLLEDLTVGKLREEEEDLCLILETLPSLKYLLILSPSIQILNVNCHMLRKENVRVLVAPTTTMSPKSKMNENLLDEGEEEEETEVLDILRCIRNRKKIKCLCHKSVEPILKDGSSKM